MDGTIDEADARMLYPQGLKKTYNYNKAMVPLAIAADGFMAIAASALSPFLSWELGFSSFILCAAFLYLVLSFIDFRL